MRPVLILFIALTIGSVLWRILPHEWNMTPFMALALFAGARLPAGPLRFLLPLGGMMLADLVLGFHATMMWVYGAMGALVLMGTVLKGKVLPWYLGGAMAGSLLFYLVTNFGVWASTQMYPGTVEGLLACYIAALPFLAKSMAADLFFTVTFFGAFAWLDQRQGAPASSRDAL